MVIFYVFNEQAMQNEMDVTKLDLTEILASATIMVISVTSSTTQGYACQTSTCISAFEITPFHIFPFATIVCRVHIPGSVHLCFLC